MLTSASSPSPAAARRLSAIFSALTDSLPSNFASRPHCNCSGGADGILTVAFAGVHRSVPSTGGGPDKPGGHNWAAGFAACTSEAQVTAIYDHDAGTRDEFVSAWQPSFGRHLQSFGDFHGMMQAAKPDILCLATRQGLHAAHIEYAALVGVRGIIVEKPFATTLVITVAMILHSA